MLRHLTIDFLLIGQFRKHDGLIRGSDFRTRWCRFSTKRICKTIESEPAGMVILSWDFAVQNYHRNRRQPYIALRPVSHGGKFHRNISMQGLVITTLKIYMSSDANR